MRISKSIFIVISSLFLLSFTSCSKSEFDSFVSDFNKEYYAVANEIDIKDTYGSIKKLQTEENKEKINNMGSMIEKIENNIPNAKKKIFEEIQTQYNGIVFLQESYDKWDELSLDEQSRINTEIWWAYKLNRDYKNGND